MTRTQILALLCAGLAAGMAVLWTVVVPGKAETTEGVQSLLIRHAHPATWAALAVLGILVALDAPAWTRTTAGVVSLVSYAAFLGALVL